MTNIAEGIFLPSYTHDSFIGRRFNLPEGSTMLCLNVQKRVLVEDKYTVIQISGLANGSQYFCNEIKFNSTTKIAWNSDIEIGYFVDHKTIENSTEVLPD